MVTFMNERLAMWLEQENSTPNMNAPGMVMWGFHSTNMTSAMDSQPKASRLRYASWEHM